MQGQLIDARWYFVCDYTAADGHTERHCERNFHSTTNSISEACAQATQCGWQVQTAPVKTAFCPAHHPGKEIPGPLPDPMR